MWPKTMAPLAGILKLMTFAAQFGSATRCLSGRRVLGPFDPWPTGGGGFDYFYGFIGGEANQCYPALYEGTTPVEPTKTPEEGYHFIEDMTDKAINWVGQQRSLVSDKPFFAYFAPGADARPAPCAQGMGRQVQGQIRCRLG